ncbi:cell wall-binding repeat-containing protein [Diaminobutyricibacter sp. McL0608]|uniref:cell wall-binding repeat-containing protein n=1 Tax=Leifsonia sp. McL0608 TaxID=3143537 RepID=UPI0031F30573
MRKLIAAVSVTALTGLALAAAAPASATDSYHGPAFRAGNNPGDVAFTPDGGKAVVVTADPNTYFGAITTYDTATHAVLWSTTVDGPGANGVAISPDGTQAYATFMGDTSTVGGGLTVVDLAHNVKLGTIVGPHRIWDDAFAPNGSKVYAVEPQFGTPQGSVAVVDPATRSILTHISVGEAPLDVIFSPDSSHAYVVNDGDGTNAGTLSVIDVAASAVTATIPLGVLPSGVAITPDGSTLFVTNSGDGTHSGTVSVVSTATNAVTATISNVGVNPNHISMSPDGTQAWVLDYPGTGVAVIDVATKAVVNRYAVTGGGPWSLGLTPDSKQAWVAIDGNDSNHAGTIAVFDVKSARWNPTVSRVSGTDRYQTSVQVAQKAFPTIAPVVFVATGLGFADALAAAAPAAKLDGPLLLTDPSKLPAGTKAEIQNLHPSTIYIVGGPGAISAAVENQLRPLASNVIRLAGVDRFDTARQVIDVAFHHAMQKVYVATGMNFPDALSASAAAGAAGIPVLLVNGTKPTLDSATTDFLTANGANAFTVIGGPNVVSAGIATQLGASGPVTRIYGADRYTTSQLINADAFTSGTKAYFATGTSFADALSGAVLAAVTGSPLYVVNPTCVPDVSETDLAGRGVTGITLIGGTGALSNAVAAMHNC